MTFSVKAWHDYPATDTPITGTSLADLETRLSSYTDTQANTAAAAATSTGPYAANVTLNNAAAAPVSIGGSLCNTGTIMQSDGTTDPTNIVNGIAASPIVMVGTHTASTWADNVASGTTWQFTAGIVSTGTRQAIAIGSAAQGQHVWGMNPNVFVPASVASGGIAYGIEVDVGYKGTGSSSVTGVLISGQSHGGTGTNTGDGLRITAQIAGQFTNGIAFYSNAAQPCTGALLIADGGISVTNGIQFNPGAAFTTAAVKMTGVVSGTATLYISANSGSTAASQGIYVEPIGGFANLGHAIYVQSADNNSTMATGLNFHSTGAGNQPVVSTGSLIVSNATTAFGIDWRTANFTSAGLAMGSNNITSDTVTGCKIGTVATQKFGFWGRNPVVQPGSAGTTHITAGYTNNSAATPLYLDGSYTGNTGSTAYTLPDLVNVLKTAGVIAL